MGYFNDYPLAQDLAQDVFARVWQYLPSFKGESSVGSWIFRIATNICLRQGERQRRISQSEVPPPPTCRLKQRMTAQCMCRPCIRPYPGFQRRTA
ncbi:sigma factor [uncultured Alistipes sp.]|uniref:RNA polymerase sigma factor n=1 Tax=uncultured Alistipes sp. TaxID=538949 RepID=UPI002625EC87|nr:sigma factor [uncultured Alistipes sp.]